MNKLLSAVVLLALVTSVGWADVPDPEYCQVLPVDGYDFQRLTGLPVEDGSSYAEIDVYVRASGGVDIENAFVEIVFDPACDDALCMCTNFVTTGSTAANGLVEFNLKFGGCCEYPVAAIIWADGVQIRGYEVVVSPDRYGSPLGGANCATELDDFADFVNNRDMPGCTDYTGDGTTNLADFAVFADAWGKTCVH